jgi:hypothetical protein
MARLTPLEHEKAGPQSPRQRDDILFKPTAVRPGDRTVSAWEDVVSKGARHLSL